MKRLNLTISFLFCYLLSFAQLDGKMRPGDRLDYNPGPQPEWEPIMIAMAAAVGCLLLCALAYWLFEKKENKFYEIVGVILSLVGSVGFIFFIGPCLITWRFWVLLVAIGVPIFVIACLVYKKREENEYLKRKKEEAAKQKEKEPIKQDLRGYTFLGKERVYATSHHIPGYKCESNMINPLNLYSVYSKEGHYFLESPFDGTLIKLEHNPYYKNWDYSVSLYMFQGKAITSYDMLVYLYVDLPNDDFSFDHIMKTFNPNYKS